jgi:hypothetical protein
MTAEVNLPTENSPPLSAGTISPNSCRRFPRKNFQFPPLQLPFPVQFIIPGKKKAGLKNSSIPSFCSLKE